MKKYIQAQGYKFRDGYSNMTDKQFYLLASNYESSEGSTLGNLVLDTEETYVLFLKSFTVESFRTTMEKIINAANADGLCATIGNSISVEKEENGHMITMNFITQGE